MDVMLVSLLDKMAINKSINLTFFCMLNERAIANRIFDLFRKSNCKENHVVPMRTVRFTLIDKLNPKEKELFPIVFNGLVSLGYFSYEPDGLASMRLSKKGYDFIYDDALVKIFLGLPWIIPSIENTDWDLAYKILWRAIGANDKLPYSLTTPKFFKIASSVSNSIDPSYKHYYEERKEKGLSLNKVDMFRDAINKVADIKERYLLYVAFQSHVEDIMLFTIKEEIDTIDPFGDIVHEEKTLVDMIKKEDSKEIYVSYSWANSEDMDKICNALDANGIPYKRDIEDCGYRQNIKKFEEEIGRGNVIIAIIDEKYIKSIHCMYEMSSMVENGYIEERLFPVVSIDKRDAEACAEFLDYWCLEYKKRKDLLDRVQAGNARSIIDEMSYCDSIVMEFTKFWTYIQKHNTLTKEELMKDDCALLVAHLKNKLN